MEVGSWFEMLADSWPSFSEGRPSHESFRKEKKDVFAATDV